MTDTYVEELIINKFMDLDSISDIPKAYQYYEDNKESEEPLVFFEQFMPEYPEGSTKYQKSQIDYDCVTRFFAWVETYINVFGTEFSTEEEDGLFTAIRDVILTTKNKYVTFYTDTGATLDVVNLYPHVAFPNEDFTRAKEKLGDDNYWYELYFIPGGPVQIELGTTGRSRWIGIMQVNICVPKTWGTKEIYARYDEIAALFRSGLILEGVRIVRTYRAASLDNDDYHCLPVTIEWQADLDR